MKVKNSIFSFYEVWIYDLWIPNLIGQKRRDFLPQCTFCNAQIINSLKNNDIKTDLI